jgi:hypothetical protein
MQKRQAKDFLLEISYRFEAPAESPYDYHNMPFFSHIAEPQLKQGEDPYEIIGV